MASGPLLKSRDGIPSPLPRPATLDLAAEARIARSRFYPVTVAYTAFAAAVLVYGIRTDARATLIAFAWGVVGWTLLEYLVHRFLLHGVFPETRGRPGRWLHARFDRMHADHHQRPWDGMHVNGHLETVPFAVALGGLAFLAAPHPAGPAFIAALVQSYVVEEWIHYAVHFHQGGGPYFRYIRRHHLYHHGVRGKEEAFGLTSHIWDVPFGTTIGSTSRGPEDPSAASRPPCAC